MIKQSSSCRGALQQPGWSGLMKSVGVEAKLQPERCQFQTTCNHAAAPLEHCPKLSMNEGYGGLLYRRDQVLMKLNNAKKLKKRQANLN